MLKFRDDSDWYDTLDGIRLMVSESTPWRDLDAASRPKFTIGLPASKWSPDDYGRAT
ncbi:unnamed protein product [Penicillium salamii]|nr:unnamed protein product [Penicillium salamii]